MRRRGTDLININDYFTKSVSSTRPAYLYSKPCGATRVPVSEVTAKDEFFNIKNVTRDDLLAAHRIPPQLMGIVPSNTGGFGTADTVAEVFGRKEIEPQQRRFAQLNDWIGEEVVRIKTGTVDTARRAIRRSRNCRSRLER